MLHTLELGKMAHESGGTQALLELCHRSRVEAAEFGAALPKPLSGHDAWRDLSLKPHLCGGLEETDDSVPQRRVWMYMSNCALWAAETQKLQVKPGAKLIQWCSFLKRVCTWKLIWMAWSHKGICSTTWGNFYFKKKCLWNEKVSEDLFWMAQEPILWKDFLGVPCSV